MGRTAFLAAIAVALFVGSPSAAASFDCTKATSRNELAICQDTGLSAADEELASKYDRLQQKLPDDTDERQQLTANQRAWLRSLTSCEGDTTCLMGAYQARITMLDDRYYAAP